MPGNVSGMPDIWINITAVFGTRDRTTRKDRYRRGRDLAPCVAPVVMRIPFEPDEARGFVAGRNPGSVPSRSGPDCFRFKKWGHARPDYFLTPAGCGSARLTGQSVRQPASSTIRPAAS